MASARFWSLIDALREAASSYAIDHVKAGAVFDRVTEDDLASYQKDILSLLKEGERWDLWAVGAILHGKLGLRFCREFVLWVVLQGKKFCGRVFRDPSVAAERVSIEDPSSEFDASCLAPFAGDIATGQPRGDAGPFWSSNLAGKPWTWRELEGMHPDLWRTYFVARDRRARPSSGTEDLDVVCDAVAPLNDWGDIYGDPDYLLAQYHRLSPDQVGLHAVCWWFMEYQNGGLDQFFRNSTGIVARETLAGLERFGARKYAALFSKALAAFPDGGPSRHRKERLAQMDTLRPGALRLKEPEEDLDGILARRIRAHPTAFFRNV